MIPGNHYAFKTWTVDVQPSFEVFDLVLLVQEKTSVPAAAIWLLRGTTPLSVLNNTLSDYNIQKHDTIRSNTRWHLIPGVGAQLPDTARHVRRLTPEDVSLPSESVRGPWKELVITPCSYDPTPAFPRADKYSDNAVRLATARAAAQETVRTHIHTHTHTETFL
ncbi:unnamed protein product [Vitrella brassicaformis CCMP3155]|uniref:Ubiquitin-like domain-containing protein n=1 Tax=Vitrella brassicaformis (strain CCMP3155) TaxID=1169540 RepID=A0A0G4FPD2_VITBC|nr:unnamed protein product [Vitrella brassicaformis CCMP3155]|eukprot:CEM15693.1 unnamed protein product [Vitrella brassicaformis CCMP3155]